MNDAIIFASALAWAVVATGAAVWITWLCRSWMVKASLDWSGLHAKLEARVEQLDKKIEKSSGAKLAAEVDDLRAAFETSRASTRRELGSLWGKLGGQRSAPAFIDGQTGLPLEGDDELAAMLALQHAKPAGPGNGSP